MLVAGCLVAHSSHAPMIHSTIRWFAKTGLTHEPALKELIQNDGYSDPARLLIASAFHLVSNKASTPSPRDKLVLREAALFLLLRCIDFTSSNPLAWRWRTLFCVLQR